MKDRALAYGFVAARGAGITVNPDLVKDEQIKGLTDLLNPKWKGKLLLPDVRTMGDAFWPMTSARLNLGDDIIKKLFVDQEPVLSRDTRQIAEFMVRGRYPIALGVNPLLLSQFQKQGLGKNLKTFHFPEMDSVNSSSSTLWLVNKAPHPNAAKVFINWLLTKDAQVVWAREVETNSRRVGVEPGNPAFAVPKGAQALPGRCRGKSPRSGEDPGHRQSGDQVGAVAAPAPDSGETVLALDGVSKLFGAAAAVDRTSLEVKRGEIFTLLGPSGCGKTTTLRLVAGLEQPDAGEITLRGRLVASAPRRLFVPPNKRNLGMVFQSYAIWPHMTVFDNVAYPLTLRGMKRAAIRDKVGRVLGLVGLEGLETRAATLLSGGQMQRLALCRALVYEPDLLLLDEPFSNLDAKLREQMRVEVKLLQRRLGITVLFVTHDQVEALSLSDRIAVMQRGRVEQVGPPRHLYERPASAFVRDFLGQTVLLRGRVGPARAGSDAAPSPWR